MPYSFQPLIANAIIQLSLREKSVSFWADLAGWLAGWLIRSLEWAREGVTSTYKLYVMCPCEN